MGWGGGELGFVRTAGPGLGGVFDDKEPKWRKREEDQSGSQAWAEVTDEEDAEPWLVEGRIRKVSERGGCGRRGEGAGWLGWAGLNLGMQLPQTPPQCVS